MKLYIRSHLWMILIPVILLYGCMIIQFHAMDFTEIEVSGTSFFGVMACYILFGLGGVINGGYLMYSCLQYQKEQRTGKKRWLVLLLIPLWMVAGILSLVVLLVLDLWMWKRHYIGYRICFDRVDSPYFVQGFFDPVRDVADVHCREIVIRIRRYLAVRKYIVLGIIIIVNVLVLYSQLEIEMFRRLRITMETSGTCYVLIVFLLSVYILRQIVLTLQKEQLLWLTQHELSQDVLRSITVLDELIDEHIVDRQLGEYYLYKQLEKDHNTARMETLRCRKNRYMKNKA